MYRSVSRPATLVLMVVAVLLAPQCFGVTRRVRRKRLPCVRGVAGTQYCEWHGAH